MGEFSVEGYDFQHSPAVRDGKFVALLIDEVNQSELTEERITQWVEALRPIFVGEESIYLLQS